MKLIFITVVFLILSIGVYANSNTTCSKDILGNVNCRTTSDDYRVPSSNTNCSRDILGNVNCRTTSDDYRVPSSNTNCSRDILGNVNCRTSSY